MPKMIMMVGIPGSGKSTWIKDFIHDEGHDFEVFSSDSLIEAEAKRQGRTYNDVFKNFIKNAENLMYAQIQEAVKNGKDFIWDQTNLTKKTRERKLLQVPKEYDTMAVVVQTDWLTLKSVNDERAKFGRALPQGILYSMANIFEPVTDDERFNKIINVIREPKD